MLSASHHWSGWLWPCRLYGLGPYPGVRYFKPTRTPPETSLNSGNTSGSIEPVLESPGGEASPDIAALVMAALQQNDSRMPTAAIILQKASELENQHQ